MKHSGSVVCICYINKAELSGDVRPWKQKFSKLLSNESSLLELDTALTMFCNDLESQDDCKHSEANEGQFCLKKSQFII